VTTSPRHRLLLAGTTAVATAWLLAGTVLGHASLVSSTPAEGSSVPISQATSVTLVFDDTLDPARSRFELVDGTGATVATGKVGADPRTMQATGLSLQWGAYQAKWTAVASDGDLTRGVVAFRLIQEGALSIGPDGSATPLPTASAAPGPGATGAGPDATLPILAGLVLVVGLGAWVFRRSRSA
jgi:methionine-rich copper-binding protein CopC